MKIRIINEKDWEKSYELDKSIIRVGSQINCDVLINDSDVPALLMQITRSGTIDVRNVMRFFAENVTLTRGEQTFPPDLNVPYFVLDGDKVTFGLYRMIIELESDKSRVRQSEHMRAEMFLSDRDLTPESPISGGLLLKNLGTEKPCQFRMNIKGIPSECLYTSPMPFLHPDASSSVGFTISHLKTKPEPGLHTVSITLSAPDDYYGEMLEFNQNIYVHPVYDNVMILEDDSDKLAGAVKLDTADKDNSLPKPVDVLPDTNVRDSGMMNLDESVYSASPVPEEPVRVLGKDGDAPIRNFEDGEDDEDIPGYRRKKERVVVIRKDDDNLFEGETPEENTPAAESGKQDVPETDQDSVVKTIEKPSAETGSDSSLTLYKRSGSSKRKKKSEAEVEIIPEEPQEPVRPTTKPVKFNQDVVVIRSSGTNGFDDEPVTDAKQVTGSESPAEESAKPSETGNPVEGTPGKVKAEPVQDLPEMTAEKTTKSRKKQARAAEENTETDASKEEKSEPVKKTRKKKSAKEDEKPILETVSGPDHAEQNIMALGKFPMAESVQVRQDEEPVSEGSGLNAAGQPSPEERKAVIEIWPPDRTDEAEPEEAENQVPAAEEQLSPAEQKAETEIWPPDRTDEPETSETENQTPAAEEQPSPAEQKAEMEIWPPDRSDEPEPAETENQVPAAEEQPSPKDQKAEMEIWPPDRTDEVEPAEAENQVPMAVEQPSPEEQKAEPEIWPPDRTDEPEPAETENQVPMVVEQPAESPAEAQSADGKTAENTETERYEWDQVYEEPARTENQTPVTEEPPAESPAKAEANDRESGSHPSDAAPAYAEPAKKPDSFTGKDKPKIQVFGHSSAFDDFDDDLDNDPETGAGSGDESDKSAFRVVKGDDFD